MTTPADAILFQLQTVDRERAARALRPALSDRVTGLKAFQQRRFVLTYADLLATPRYGPATHFFLDELYGPVDFTRRDSQFARVVPTLVRLFPRELVETVGALAELHALSETLDTAMAHHLDQPTPTPHDYLLAWQATGRNAERQAQIELTSSVAARLDRLTRKPLLRNSLRLMRQPARAAGLAELQGFLEAGFDTFRAMNGADEFIATVRQREEALVSTLFAADPPAGRADPGLRRALAALPPEETA